MYWISFVLAVIAAACFLANALGHNPGRLGLTPFGLCLLTVAWILQLLVTSGAHWTV